MEKSNENAKELTTPAATVGRQKSKERIGAIVSLGIMTAIVVVLQLLSSVIHFGPFSITLALTPIIVGGALYGMWGGAWLGAVMGVVILLQPDTAAFMTVNAPGTILVVLLKSSVAGLLACIVFKALEKKNVYAAVIASGVTAPVVNTGLFLAGCYLFFMDTITEWAGGTPALEFILFSMIGMNFIVELVVNLALSTVTVTVIKYAKKMLNNR